MARARKDELAQRLAQRLQSTPVKGRSTGAPPAPNKRTSIPPNARPRPGTPAGAPSRTRAATISEQSFSDPEHKMRRGEPGGRLRGHLVASELHQRARRRKVVLQSERGERCTWEEVMRLGITQLLTLDMRQLESRLIGLRRGRSSTGRPRLVQATLPAELDRRFVRLQLDVSDQLAGTVSYERLWAVAIALWLENP